MSESIGVYAAFFLYAILIVLIGIFFYSKSKSNLSSYFLGDRKVNSWVTALSAQASDMSAWLFMSVPASAYLFGFRAEWIVLGLLLGTYLNWKLVARRMRNFTEVFGNSITVPEYLQNRFKTRSPLIRVFCSAVILIFFLLYVASGFSAEAKLFNELFGLDYHTGLFLGALIVMFYTFMGGFLAVSWVDFFQSILMFFALLAVPISLFILCEPEAMERAVSFGAITSGAVPRLLDGSVGWGEIVSGLGWGLGYFGMPHILVRFMAARSASDIKKSRRIAMVWVSLSLVAALLIGVLGEVHLSAHDFSYANQAEAEKIFMRLSVQLFPPFVGGVLLSAILSAIMSTVSSQLLVIGSAMVNDIWALFRPQTSARWLMGLSKLSIVLVTGISIALAWYPDSTVMGFVSYAWAGFGATFAPVVLLSLLWKRLTLVGALVGLGVGTVGVIVWESFSLNAVTGLTSIVPCFMISLVAIVATSLLTKSPSKEVIADFEKAEKM